MMSEKQRLYGCGRRVGSKKSRFDAPETSAERPGACKMIVATIVVENDGRWWRFGRSPKPAPRT